METVSFGEALKEARRCIYQWPSAWRVLVLARNFEQATVAFEEAARTLEAGSLVVESVDYSNRTIKTERGGYFAFRSFDAGLDGLRGITYTHVICLFSPDVPTEQILNSMLRSPTVPYERMRLRVADL